MEQTQALTHASEHVPVAVPTSATDIAVFPMVAPLAVPQAAPQILDQPEPRARGLEHFAGDREFCAPFLSNCSLLFDIQPCTFSTEVAEMAYTISHLTGKVRLWGTSEWDCQTPAC